MAPEPAPDPRLDQLVALLSSPPPRTPPPELLRSAKGQAASLGLVFFGFVFGSIGLAIALLLFPWNLSHDLRLATAGTGTVPGRIESVAPTGIRINKRRVMEQRFVFATPDGARHEGVCFTTGDGLRPGQPVPVRYAPDDPTLACPAGARLNRTGAWSLLLLLLPASGAALVAGVLAARRRAARLLTHGVVAEARVTAVIDTGVQINHRTLYRIQLLRLGGGSGAPLVLRRSEPAAVAFARERLASGQPVFLLSDPGRPARVLLPETL